MHLSDVFKNPDHGWQEPFLVKMEAEEGLELSCNDCEGDSRSEAAYHRSGDEVCDES